MGKRDPRIDKYIRSAKPFAKPLLTHIRALVHRGCPEVEETLKWGHPAFMYKGILCGLAAFNEHCTFGFWRGSLIAGAKTGKSDEAMGQFGRITRRADLPSDAVLIGYVREAVKIHDAGTKRPSKPRPKANRKLIVPRELVVALAANTKAHATFEGFTYSNKKEYAEWIAEAKTSETRDRRLATAIEWMAEGKARNWKYARKGK